MRVVFRFVCTHITIYMPINAVTVTQNLVFDIFVLPSHSTLIIAIFSLGTGRPLYLRYLI